MGPSNVVYISGSSRGLSNKTKQPIDSWFKVQIKGTIKDLRAKIEETLYKKPELQSTNVHRILKEIKEVQRKIQQYVAHLVQLKAKTEAALEQIQEEFPFHWNIEETTEKSTSTNRERSTRRHFQDGTKGPDATNRKGCKELHIKDRSTWNLKEADKPGKDSKIVKDKKTEQQYSKRKESNSDMKRGKKPVSMLQLLLEAV